jgi:hypothetical protein
MGDKQVIPLFSRFLLKKMTKNRGAGIFRSGTKNSGEFRV